MRQPDGGSIAIEGRPLADWPLEELARKRAYLPQTRSDAFSYRVLETVLAARHPYHAQRYWEGSDDHAIAKTHHLNPGRRHVDGEYVGLPAAAGDRLQGRAALAGRNPR